MKVLFLVSLVGGVIASSCAAMRWLRVAQREHYLAFSVSRFAWRWWRSDRTNALAGAVGVGAMIASVFVGWSALVVATVCVVFPWGLTLRGHTSKLHWTRRLTTLSAMTAVLCGAAIGISGGVAGIRGAAVGSGIVAMILPLVIDLALMVLAPLEGVLARRYVVRAEKQIALVRPIIVGITGSYGKTSTKRHLAHYLSHRYRTVASPHSFNNQAGLTRTVNEFLPSGTEVLIAEMGTYGIGEIAALCRWLPPSIAIITAIGPVHLERFKSLDRTLTAKAEIAVTAKTVVLNTDDERLFQFAAELATTEKRIIRCSASDRNASVAVLAIENGIEVVVEGISIGTVEINCALTLARTNVACAIGAAIALGCDPRDLVEATKTLPGTEHRLEKRSASSGAFVLDDTFNSNPKGARLALDVLAASSESNKRLVVVTPGMVELGKSQFKENMSFAQQASTIATDMVIVGRTNRRALLMGLRGDVEDEPIPHEGHGSEAAHDVGPTVRVVRDRKEAVEYISATLGPGDVVLYENDLPDHYP